MNIGADGMKTGFTKEAGYGLVGSAVQNGVRLIVVVNGLQAATRSAPTRRKRLLEWGFNTFEAGRCSPTARNIAEAKVYGGEQGRVPLVAREAVQLMVPRGVSEKIIARVVYTGPVPRAGRRRASRSAC